MARYRFTKEGWINLGTGLPEEPSKKSWEGTSNLHVYNADRLLEDGVKSPLDGKMYSGNKAWKAHLRAHGCVEVGNEMNKTKPRTEVRGDFNVRSDLARATHEVLNKQR